MAQIEAREARLEARLLKEREAAERERAADLEARGEKVAYTESNGIEVFSIARPGRKIHGICSTSTPNAHKYALLSRGCEINLLPPIPLLSAHQPGPIGEVVLVRKRERELYCHARIFDNEAGDYAWNLIEDGKLTSFSAAADPKSLHLQAEADGIKFYDRWRLLEVSLCERGAVPECNDTVEILGATQPIRRRSVVVPNKTVEPVAPESRFVEMSESEAIHDPKTGRLIGMRTVKRLVPANAEPNDFASALQRSLKELSVIDASELAVLIDAHVRSAVAKLADARLGELENMVDHHVRARIANVEERLATLESRSKKIAYAGVWAPDAHYEAGEFVTDKGGLWCCLESSHDRPGESLRWQLAVKSAAARR